MVRLPDAARQVGNVDTAKDFKDIKDIRDIKEMPVKVLRGLFSGIGQLLLAADRFRADEAPDGGINQDEQFGPPTGLDGELAAQHLKTVDYVESAAGSGKPAGNARGRDRKPPGATTAGRSGSAGKQRAADTRQFRSLDATGNVRLLTPDMPAESTSRSSTRSNAAASRGPSNGRSRQTGKAATAETPAAGRKAKGAPDLPVPGYDGRSLASLRSRLRYLDVHQLRMLLEHEKSASNRADVVTMFERRIAKIESGPDAS